jgi:F0F1-type ATP synthase delta subunit
VKTECLGALAHEYDFQSDKVRLDNIAIWTSAHITEDAEKEFTAPGNLAKIQVLKAGPIYALIHEHCPDLLARVPQCSLSVYLRDRASPPPKPIKLLGKSLDPLKNFLVPTISAQPAFASSRLSTRNHMVSPNTDTISIESLLERTGHIVIKGDDLSGKSYLLEHLQAVAAGAAMLPFLLKPEHFATEPRTVFHILAKILPSFSPNDLEQISKNQRLLVLIDDFDELGEKYRDQLLKLNPREVSVLGTAGTMSARAGVDIFHIVGVELESIVPFLRSLDLQRDTVFTDRAHSFITRSLAQSGLPESPFTVAMLLQECQVSPSKFSTPTMGRLIERFIELQLGSHSEERTLVDFETKREFLTRLAGRVESSLPRQELQKRLAKHVHTRSLPHEPSVFLLDLLEGGVLAQERDGRVVWAHPVIKQYFWVKNLVTKGKTRPIERILQTRPDFALAAIVGSQLANAGDLIKTLANDLAQLKMPSRQELINTVREMAPDILPSEQSEAKMLEDIEKVATDEKIRKERRQKVADVTSQYQLTDADRKRVEERVGPLMQEIIQSKLHIGQNLAAVVVNARDTKSVEKELAVRQILLSNARMGHLFQELLLLMYEGRTRVIQIASWLRIYLTLSHTDTVLGDPFLLPVFRTLLKQRLDDETYVMLLDLVLGCANENTEPIAAALRKINRPEITNAFYFRIVALYFFRFHREKERKALRRLLTEVRKIHPFVPLPTVRSPS